MESRSKQGCGTRGSPRERVLGVAPKLAYSEWREHDNLIRNNELYNQIEKMENGQTWTGWVFKSEADKARFEELDAKDQKHEGEQKLRADTPSAARLLPSKR